MMQVTGKKRALFSFSRWMRKGYAVFRSLGREVRIAVLSVVYSIVVVPGAVWAQTSADTLRMREVDLEEVVVTAGRTPVGAQQVARMVTTLSRVEVERVPAQSISELLRVLPSADIRQRGPLGAQADISVRGGSFDQTLVLLNGINVSDPQTGHHHLNLPVDPESISRVEFLTGPAARAFGPNAFNGVINLITGPPSKNHLRLSASAGAYGLFRVSGHLALGTRKTSHFLSPGYTTSAGYLPNTDFRGTTLFYRAESLFRAGTLSFQAGVGDRRFGANSFYSLRYPDQFEATKTRFLSAGFVSRSPEGFSASAFVRRHHDRFELIRDNPAIPFNVHRSTTSGVNLNYILEGIAGKSSLGVDIRGEHILSTVLGEPLASPVAVRGGEALYFTRSAGRLNTALYGEHRMERRRLILAAGAMAHLVSGSRKIGFYPGADAAFRIHPAFSLYGSLNKTLRMPTFTDLYYTSPIQQANPRLKPEKAVSAEGGLRLHSPGVRGTLAVFSRKGREMIDWVKDPHPDSLIWRSMNHSQVDFRGVEGSLRYRPGELRPWTRRFIWLESGSLAWTALRGRSTAGELLSRYTADYLRHQIMASADIGLGPKTVLSLRWTWRDRNGAWPGPAGEVVSYRPISLTDAKITRKGRLLNLFVSASNLFDEEWMDFGGLRQPGFWLSGGISFEQDWPSL